MLVGFPVKEFKIRNKEGKETWITEQEIARAGEKGFRVVDKRMSHAVPEWIQGKKEGGILILDDFSRAEPRFIQATMELTDRQQYVSWKLPKNWSILLTTNPDSGDYNVTSLDVAQQTRFISIDLKFDEHVWAKWAESTQLDGRCINFILMYPHLITQKINPRAVTTFFNSISSIKDFMKELPLIQIIGEGSVGVEFSAMFTSFINNKLDKIISPQDMLNKPENVVEKLLSDAVGEDDEFRADISSILATRLVNYSLHFAKTNSVSDAVIDRICYFTTVCKSFTNDLKYYIVKEILNGNKQKFAKMMLNPEVIKMSIK